MPKDGSCTIIKRSPGGTKGAAYEVPKPTRVEVTEGSVIVEHEEGIHVKPLDLVYQMDYVPADAVPIDPDVAAARHSMRTGE